jgi:hypothetical protein
MSVPSRSTQSGTDVADELATVGGIQIVLLNCA